MKRAIVGILFICVASAAAVGQTTAPTTRPSTRPARVTVRMDGLRVVDAVEVFARQTGTVFMYAEPKASANTMTLDLVDVPVLEAVERFLDAAACRPIVHEADRAVSLYDAGGPVPVLHPVDGVLVLLDGVTVDATVGLHGRATYAYRLQLTVLFDPARDILAVASPPMINDVMSVGGDFEADPNRQASLQRVGGRPMGVFPMDVRLTSDRRIERFDAITLQLRVWQAARRTTATIDLQCHRDGGRVEADGLVIDFGPAPARMDETAWPLTVGGQLVKRYKSGPWAQSLAGCVSVTDRTGETTTRVKFIPRGGDSVEFQIGGRDFFADRQGRTVPPGAPRLITIAVPTRVKVIDVPLTLQDLRLP